MIIGSYYAYKKGRKRYQKHKAEKELKLKQERGELLLEDPSKELDDSCLAKTQSMSTHSNDSDSGSELDEQTRRELESDPDFLEYMEQQKKLYLKQQRDKGLPPSYNSVTSESKTSSMYSSSNSSWSPVSAMTPQTPHSRQIVQEMEGSDAGSDYSGDIAKRQSQRPDLETIVEADSTPVAFELPGNMPAILPDTDRSKMHEMPG